MIPATSTSIVGGLGLTAILISAWSTIKMYANKIYGLFIIKVSINNDHSKQAIKKLLIDDFKRSEFSLKSYMSFNTFVKPLDRKRAVAYKQIPMEPVFFWRNRRPILVSWKASGKDTVESFSLSFLRWTFNPDLLMKEAMDKLNNFDDNYSTEDNRFTIIRHFGTLNQGTGPQDGAHNDKVNDATAPVDPNEGFIPLGYSFSELGSRTTKSPFNYLSLNKECEDALYEARLWKKSEQWYKDHSIPWKRGWLLYGPPGTGKTSFTRALAMDLNMPVISFDLSTMTSQDFVRYWSNLIKPCVVLLEDMDTVFNGRKNIIDQKKGLSFDCLLNSIDGVENTDGIFLVITTNDIDKIDPAIGVQIKESEISSRPGRIDRTLLLSSPDKEGRYKIAKRILNDFPEKIDEIVEAGIKDTGAQFQERCSSIALKLFWEKPEKIKVRKAINNKYYDKPTEPVLSLGKGVSISAKYSG